MKAVGPGIGPHEDLVRDNLSAVVRGCDIVFGTASIGLALTGVWLFAVGRLHLATVIALWAHPLFNFLLSAKSRGSDQLRSAIVRGVASLPLATFLYVAERGALAHQWVSALMVVLGTTLSAGIATRRPYHGFGITAMYGVTMVVAAVVRYGSLDLATVCQMIGVVIAGLLFSLVASQLGGSLDEACRQRNDAREQKERSQVTADQLAQRTAELMSTLDSLRVEVEQRARMEIELRQAQKLESVGRLAAGVAHEINTPIQFINDNVQFVREAMDDLFFLIEKLGQVQHRVIAGEPAQADAAAASAAIESADLPYLIEHLPAALDSAVAGLERVKTIVRSMREFAHPDAKAMEPADLNRAVESTLMVACNEYKYVAELETELGEIPPVWCHVGELNQVVLNLVVNAAHAIGEMVAGTTHKGLIRVTTQREGDHAVIAISDTGTGIPDSIRDRIFDPFFTTKEVGRGTGQGLALARAVVVEKHHGELRVESTVGAGSTFFIRLPIDPRGTVLAAA
jgi:signal transduction histidine kinase